MNAKLGGSSWTCPTQKDKEGKWDLGPDPKDTLAFKFCLDPANQKTGPKDPDPPTGTIVDSKSIIKPIVPDSVLENSIDLLIRLLLEENFACQRELVDTLATEYY